MFLHEEEMLFKKYIKEASKQFGVSEYIIEKDYWIDYSIGKLNETKKVIFRGSILYYSKIADFYRYPSDLDFSISEEFYDANFSKKSQVRKLYIEKFDQNVFLCPDEKSEIQWCWLLYDSLIHNHRHYFVIETYPNDTSEAKKTEYYVWESYLRKYCQFQDEASIIQKYNPPKRTILGEPFIQIFVDKILSLSYQLSSHYKKNKYRSAQTILDIIYMSKNQEILELLNNSKNFLSLLDSRINHDIIIQKARFSKSITEEKILANNFFDYLLDEKAKELFVKYCELNEIDSEIYKHFKELITKIIEMKG